MKGHHNLSAVKDDITIGCVCRGPKPPPAPPPAAWGRGSSRGALQCTAGALAAGNFLKVENMTIAAAQQWCVGSSHCGGFTTRSTSCDAGSDTTVHEIYFKSELGGNGDPKWRTWGKANFTAPLFFCAGAEGCTPCPGGGHACAKEMFVDAGCYGQCPNASSSQGRMAAAGGGLNR